MCSSSLLWWPIHSSVLWGQTDPDWLSLPGCGNEQALCFWPLLYSKNYRRTMSTLVHLGVMIISFAPAKTCHYRVKSILIKFLHTSADLYWRRSLSAFIINLSETWSPRKDCQCDHIPFLDVFMDMGAQFIISEICQGSVVITSLL